MGEPALARLLLAGFPGHQVPVCRALQLVHCSAKTVGHMRCLALMLEVERHAVDAAIGAVVGAAVFPAQPSARRLPFPFPAPPAWLRLEPPLVLVPARHTGQQLGGHGGRLGQPEAAPQPLAELCLHPCTCQGREAAVLAGPCHRSCAAHDAPAMRALGQGGPGQLACTLLVWQAGPEGSGVLRCCFGIHRLDAACCILAWCEQVGRTRDLEAQSLQSRLHVDHTHGLYVGHHLILHNPENGSQGVKHQASGHMAVRDKRQRLAVAAMQGLLLGQRSSGPQDEDGSSHVHTCLLGDPACCAEHAGGGKRELIILRLASKLTQVLCQQMIQMLSHGQHRQPKAWHAVHKQDKLGGLTQSRSATSGSRLLSRFSFW